MFSFRTTPLEDQLDRTLQEGRIGCFCTQNCWDTGRSRWMYDIFRQRGNLQVVFSPRDAELTPGTNHIDFDLERLQGLNAVVVEIQDVGVRYFNYTKDVMRLMEMLQLLGEDAPSLYVVDHINPSGRVVEGTIPAVVGEMFVPKVAHRQRRRNRGEVPDPHHFGAGDGLQPAAAAVDHRARVRHPGPVQFLPVQRRRPVEQHDRDARHRHRTAV